MLWPFFDWLAILCPVGNFDGGRVVCMQVIVTFCSGSGVSGKETPLHKWKHQDFIYREINEFMSPVIRDPGGWLHHSLNPVR